MNEFVTKKDKCHTAKRKIEWKIRDSDIIHGFELIPMYSNVFEHIRTRSNLCASKLIYFFERSRTYSNIFERLRTHSNVFDLFERKGIQNIYFVVTNYNGNEKPIESNKTFEHAKKGVRISDWKIVQLLNGTKESIVMSRNLSYAGTKHGISLAIKIKCSFAPKIKKNVIFL